MSTPPILVPFGPDRPLPEGCRWCFACNGTGQDYLHEGGESHPTTCEHCKGEGHCSDPHGAPLSAEEREAGDALLAKAAAVLARFEPIESLPAVEKALTSAGDFVEDWTARRHRGILVGL